MAKDFFGNLGQALSKTAKELSGRAEDVYETQRLKNKISAEERQIDKIMADLGKIVYQRYKEEVPVDDAQKALCEQIDQRMEQIEQLRTDINELKIRTRRICPSCGKEVEKNAAFCKFCGAACPTQEEEVRRRSGRDRGRNRGGRYCRGYRRTDSRRSWRRSGRS